LRQTSTPKPPGAGESSYDLIDPGTLWAALNLLRGVTFLDLGCGQGNYSLAAADLIGPAGVVYAVDLWEEGIAALQERAAREGRGNLKALVAPYGFARQQTVKLGPYNYLIMFGKISNGRIT